MPEFPTTDPQIPSGLALETQLRELNQALLISSVSQHEAAAFAKAAEAVAREEEARYRALFDSIDEGFCVIELEYDDACVVIDWVYIEVNPAFARQSGLPDAVGKRMSSLVPSLEARWFEQYGEVVATGKPVRILAQIKAMAAWFDVYAFRVGEAAERRLAVLFTNVSARVKMEAELKESEVRYRRLFQSSQDGVILFDAQTGAIVDFNASMSGMLGREVSELVGQEIVTIGLQADESAYRAIFAQLQDNGFVRYDHLPVRRSTGESVPVECVSVVYREGERMMAQCTMRDISLRRELEKRVSQQAQELAAQLRAKDEFLAMLSHELRNPLAPIRSAVYLLKLHGSVGWTPLQVDAVRIIERQVNSMNKLVSDLLEVSRVTSARVRLDLAAIDLNTLIRHAVETVNPLIVSHRHKLVLHLGDEPGRGGMWVIGDALRLEEALVNLLTNAAKFTPDGGKIEVWCERVEGTKNARIRVRDNGVGITKELLPRIFELFTQGDRSLDRAQGGLGIGLCLAKRMVEMHEGKIEAFSPAPGVESGGSEFIVTLPLSSASVIGPAQQGAGEGLELAVARGGKKVLLVDDNVDFVRMLLAIMEHKGYVVRVAHAGPEALRISGEWHPEVALLDIGLPGIDGYEVARRMRAQSGGEHIRIIAVSGYGSESDVAMAREAGFDGHQVKPVDFVEIEKMINAGRGGFKAGLSVRT